MTASIHQVQSAMRILILCAQFTAEPETFPVFQAYTRKLIDDVPNTHPEMSAEETEEAQRRLRNLIGSLTPELLQGCGAIVHSFAQIGDMIGEAVIMQL